MPWLIFKRRLDFCKDVSLGSFGFVDTQNHHFKKHECHQWLWQIHCNINEKSKMLQRFQPWSVRPQKLQSTRQQSHRWKRGESLLPLLRKIGRFFAKPWASVQQSQIRKNPLLHSHWQHHAWDIFVCHHCSNALLKSQKRSQRHSFPGSWVLQSQTFAGLLLKNA